MLLQAVIQSIDIDMTVQINYENQREAQKIIFFIFVVHNILIYKQLKNIFYIKNKNIKIYIDIGNFIANFY